MLKPGDKVYTAIAVKGKVIVYDYPVVSVTERVAFLGEEGHTWPVTLEGLSTSRKEALEKLRERLRTLAQKLTKDFADAEKEYYNRLRTVTHNFNSVGEELCKEQP